MTMRGDRIARGNRIGRGRSRIAKAGSALAVAVAVGATALVAATPAAAAPVGCTDDFYFATADTITQRAADGTLTPISTGTLDPWTIGLNPVDGNLYALPYDMPTGNHLFRVEADGASTDLGAVVDLPAGVLYSVGGFDDDGTFWIATSTTLYAVNLTAMTATSVPLSAGLLGDFAFIDGALYAQAGSIFSPQLARVNPATGGVTAIPVPAMISATSVWTVDGHLYISQGTTIAEVLGYDTAAPTLLQVATGFPSAPAPVGPRDGASCPTGPSPFLNADDDNFTATPLSAPAGGSAGVVFGNDTQNGAAVVSAAVTATVTGDGGLTGVAIAGDGTLMVPPGSSPGTYAVTYRLCAVASPTLCDMAVATVIVAAAITPAAPALPSTGVDTSGSLWLAALLILAGAVVVALRRRRLLS
jgi:LPXTG-motif cell wall-anchored protein